MIDEPVQKACGSLRKLNSTVDQRIHSSAQVLRCSAIIASTKANSSDEVAVAGGVEAVGRHAVETQSLGDVGAIDGQAGAGQRGGAQAQHVGPAAAIGQPAAVALELLAIGQPVVRGQHRLGPLRMGIAGQDHVQVAVAAAHEGPLQVDQPLVDLVDRLADPEPQVGRDLIVAAAAGMELAAGVAEPVDQGPLDVHVDIFQFGREREAVLLNFLADLAQGLLNLAAFVVAEQADLGQHLGMGDRCLRYLAHRVGGRSSRFR